MHISQLIKDEKRNIDVKGITNNSKNVKKDYIFVITNPKYHLNEFIDEAINKGAILIISHRKLNYPNSRIHKNPCDEYIRLLQCFYHYNKNIYTVGITGTDGKTTTSTLLTSIFNEQAKSAYIGTNGVCYLDTKEKQKNTTPPANIIYSSYEKFGQNSIKDVIMEVSSEGIIDKRIDKLNFNGAIFTNLSHEHLNTHKNMKSYFLCKSKLFRMLPQDGLLIYNADDKYSKHLRLYTKAKLVGFGLNNGDYRVISYDLKTDGSTFIVRYKNKLFGPFNIKLVGLYNVYNAVAAVAYANELGIPLDLIKKGLTKVNEVNGRFMSYHDKNKNFIIDYAHTPNGLKCLLQNVKLIYNRKIILICGAAGEKDKTKRPLMGTVAAKYADVTIFTSEDPKKENLFSIMSDLTRNLKKSDYYLTLSRFEAIKLAITKASKNDIIIITGKGEEESENILGHLFKGSDLELIKKALASYA